MVQIDDSRKAGQNIYDWLHLSSYPVAISTHF